MARDAKVLTSLAGRSRATVLRAQEAGMADAHEDEIAASDYSLHPAARRGGSRSPSAGAGADQEQCQAVYVDCNAINPATVARVAAAIAPTGCAFVDAGIIGPPPPRQSKVGIGEPRFYASGAAASRFAALRDYGLDIRLLDGPPGAASALKMSYAGITKGTQALGAAMMLAAVRSGSADALFAELSLSQKEMLAQFTQQLPQMPAKAYRWVAEMHEIAGFVGADPAVRVIYQGAAHFYERIAKDFAADKNDVTALMAFLRKGNGGA